MASGSPGVVHTGKMLSTAIAERRQSSNWMDIEMRRVAVALALMGMLTSRQAMAGTFYLQCNINEYKSHSFFISTPDEGMEHIEYKLNFKIDDENKAFFEFRNYFSNEIPKQRAHDQCELSNGSGNLVNSRCYFGGDEAGDEIGFKKHTLMNNPPLAFIDHSFSFNKISHVFVMRDITDEYEAHWKGICEKSENPF